MALQFSKTLNVKRDDGSQVFPGGLISVNKANGAECDADIAAQVAAKVATAQGNLTELNQIASNL